VRQALSEVTWPGRFEKLDNYNIILDAAHNPHSATALVATWEEQYPNQKAHIIFGAVEQKNTDKVLAIIAPITENLHLTPTNSARTLSLVDLQSALPSGIAYTVHESLDDALSVVNDFNETTPALICGSIFLIGQAKAQLMGTDTRSSEQ